MRPVVTVVLLLVLMFMTDSARPDDRRKQRCQERLPLVPCGSGWNRLDSERCMKIAPTTETYDDAEAYCVSEDGHLVAFGGLTDLPKVLCLWILEKDDVVPHWVGAKKREGTFEWAAGGGPVSDGSRLNFLNQMPEDCAEISAWGFWKSASCSAKKNFVCQKIG